MNIAETLRRAFEHHRNGQLAQARVLYQQILGSAPDHAPALHLLGLLLHQTARHDEAVQLIRRSLEIAPDQPDAHTNLGGALRALGRIDEAAASYRRSIELQPDNLRAWNEQGILQMNHGQLDDAIQSFQRAVACGPEIADVHSNLGLALLKKGHAAASIASCQRAIELNPQSALAWNNLGLALDGSNQPDDAIAAFRRAAGLAPGAASVRVNLGNALRAHGRLDEAASFLASIPEDGAVPAADIAAAWGNLADALSRQGRLVDAIAGYRKALAWDSSSAQTLNGLGNALKDIGRIHEAVDCFRQSIALKSDPVAHSNLLLYLHYLPDFDTAAAGAEHQRWNEAYAKHLRQRHAPLVSDSSPQRRLRVGYVSADFREHSVSFFMESLLGSHDPRHVETYCYADIARPDAVTQRVQKQAHHFRDITGSADGDVADLIRRDQIAILIDLAGHTAGNRLLVFARKPAPVQVSYLGYLGSTGLDAIDYRVTDVYLDPPDATAHYSERLTRLPRTFACYHPPGNAPDVAPAPAASNGYVTFGSFNVLAKVSRATLESWARILQAVRGSRLLLVAHGLDDPATRIAVGHMVEACGVPADRVEMHGYQPLDKLLALYNRIDLLLDTHPVNGHTTTCHALWMGVPVVSVAGDRYCARLGLSVLSNLSLSELVAHSADEYVRIAIELANDPERLAAMRQMLRPRMRRSPLVDAAAFAVDVETAFRSIWQESLASQR